MVYKKYIKKMLKCTSLILAAILLFTHFNIYISAENKAGNGELQWFFKKNGSQQPILHPSLQMINNYNSFYIGCPNEKVIYITFDAGYENGNIEKTLDILKKNDVKAAFFILEHLITANTDLIIRMANEGHMVANHTCRHKNMATVTEKEQFASHLANLEDIYKQYTGFDMAKVYRPPEGKFNELNLLHATELGYKTVFWSFAYADWDNKVQPDPEKAYKNIIENTHNGEIILFHPTSSTNAEILDRLIKTWKDMGYRFGSLDELKYLGNSLSGIDE